MNNRNENELGEALERLIAIKMRAAVIVEGVITAYNADERTADITILGTPYFSVPLRVLINSQASFFEIPTAGTNCLVEFRSGNIRLPQILFIDQGDKLLINYKTMVEFNGGLLGGIPKVIELTAKLNNLENAFNNLVTLFNAHVHTGVTTGGGSSGPTPSQDGTHLTPTLRGDIEDTKVTH